VRENDLVVSILWHVNPFRGDKFEDAWRPAAAAALDYGAVSWAFWRSKDDPLDFTQIAVFPDKTAFERYWFSEQIAEMRAEISGWYVVPVLPAYFRVVAAGELEPAEIEG
jgi:hypothetical protein